MGNKPPMARLHGPSSYYFVAWVYPYRVEAWQPVHVSKVISWKMPMVVSLSIVQVYRALPWLSEPARELAAG